MTDQKREAWWYEVESTCQNKETGEIHEFVNVVPAFGPEHIMSPDCWCYPSVGDDNVITHNIMH